MYKRSKRRRIIVSIICIVVIAALVATFVLASAMGQEVTEEEKQEVEEADTVEEADAAEEADASEDEANERTIPNGIYIGEVAVGGMTAEQAEKAIRSYVESLGDQTVMLSAGDETTSAAVSELGFTEDVDSTVSDALNYGQTGNLLKRYKEQKDLEVEEKVLPLILTADEEQVRSYLEEHASELSRDAVDYGLTREDGTFVVQEGEEGQALDIDESVDLILSAFSQGWEEDPTIVLSVDVTEPEGSEEELALVQDVLGTFSTDYSSSSDARKTNIKTGASLIDGSVIYPGETFSVVNAVTPFDEEHGYAEAPSYESGATVDTYGGGICQVSTTLYNAVIRAELQIDERHGHSMTVSYVDPSDDAAIAEGIKDLQFTNNTDAPIYIEGYTDGATISFTVYGHETRPANRTVSFESETVETTEPTGTEYRASTADFGTVEAVQNAHAGVVAQLWKIVTVDGVEESREEFNTTIYQMTPAVYEIGVSTSNEAAQSAIYSAIASQDLNQIYAVIGSYS